MNNDVIAFLSILFMSIFYQNKKSNINYYHSRDDLMNVKLVIFSLLAEESEEFIDITVFGWLS